MRHSQEALDKNRISLEVSFEETRYQSTRDRRCQRRKRSASWWGTSKTHSRRLKQKVYETFQGIIIGCYSVLHTHNAPTTFSSLLPWVHNICLPFNSHPLPDLFYRHLLSASRTIWFDRVSWKPLMPLSISRRVFLQNDSNVFLPFKALCALACGLLKASVCTANRTPNSTTACSTSAQQGREVA